MGRELRRVPLDFNWPLNEVWIGFLNPHYKWCAKCPECDGSGSNDAVNALSDLWYGKRPDGSYAKHKAWCYNLTQEDVDALLKADRLWDFTRRPMLGEIYPPEAFHPNGWLKEDNGYRPTADQVNRWNRNNILGLDCIAQTICVDARAKREGTYGKCELCAGQGELWRSKKDKEAADNYQDVSPPEGPGYQIWETVSEGSPITPVFLTASGLAQYCSTTPDWRLEESSYETWLKFILGDGWAPSFVMKNGKFMSGVEAAGE